jgi:Kdo2-lipid IVA lauroyltransferase/acyltransferase
VAIHSQSSLPFRKRWKRARRSLYPMGLHVVESWAARLSDSQCETWSRRLGGLGYLFLAPERKKASNHLRLAYGDSLTPSRMRRIVLGSFRSLAMSGLECLRFRHVGTETLLARTEVDGWEHVERAHEAGRGGIFVTGHIGNWELCAAYVAMRGLTMNVVARRIYVETLNEKLISMRAGMGVRTLYRDESMRAMIRRLQANEFLGILPDQDVRRIGGIFVEFFGRPAYTPVGPALLALASGSPILMARDIRNGIRHRLTVDPPIYADRTAPREQEVQRLVMLYTHRLEAFVREHPEQWVWMHRRWRTRPPATPPSPGRSPGAACSPSPCGAP